MTMFDDHTCRVCGCTDDDCYGLLHPDRRILSTTKRRGLGPNPGAWVGDEEVES